MRGVVPNDMSSTCAQGGIPRPLRGYQPIMEPSSPAAAWQYHHSTIIPKQEPMDHEERNDSGISGSDFQSSSPGSDHSDNIRYSSPNMTNVMHHAAYYPPMTHQQFNGLPISFHNDHNPLTPPSSEPMASPKNLQSVTPGCSNTEDKSEGNNAPPTTLTPCTSPEENTPQACLPMNDDALKRLQIAMEKNGFLPPPISPNPSESSKEYANKSDMDTDDYDEQAINVPKVNSHGKVKQFKCKQCKFVAITKSDFWQHSRIHIKEDKLLTCPKCPFVTEFKHHFEYHMRNHTGSKPFKCSECNYSCVNKSMLNSHLKSHSEVYQYACADCRYVTKYVHSLKIHLRKYTHKPAMVRNPDGTPNPLPVIDVYGTRRGPKIKFQKQKTVQEGSPQPDTAAPFPFNHFMLNSPQMQLPFAHMPFFAGFPGPNPFLLQNLETLIRQNQESARENQDSSLAEESDEKQPQQTQTEAEVLDLSKPSEQPIQKNRRKGRAFKLAPGHDNASDEEEDLTNIFNNVEVVENIPTETSTTEESSDEKDTTNNNKDNYSCQFCIINFGDPVLYTIHMGYHGFQNPFTCNMCGEECKDRVSFFLHIARTSHS